MCGRERESGKEKEREKKGLKKWEREERGRESERERKNQVRGTERSKYVS